MKSRSFELPDPLVGWKKAVVERARGSYAVRTDSPPSAGNPHYVRITSEAGSYGLVNFGFRGMGIRKGERYTVAVHARRVGADPATLRFELETWQNKGYGATGAHRAAFADHAAHPDRDPATRTPTYMGHGCIPCCLRASSLRATTSCEPPG